MNSGSDIFPRNTHELSYAIAWLHLKSKTYLLRCGRGKEWVCADALGNGATDADISAVEERFLWSLAHPLLPRYRVHAPAVRCKHGETWVNTGRHMKNEFGANDCIKAGPIDTFFLGANDIWIWCIGYAICFKWSSPYTQQRSGRRCYSRLLFGIYDEDIKKVSIIYNVHVSALENRYAAVHFKWLMCI